MNYYLNGKAVSKSSIPKEAVLKRTVTEEYYETPAYTKAQTQVSLNYFKTLRDNRDELEKHHG